MNPSPRWKQALSEQGNLAALSGAAALAFAMLNPVPLLVAAACETAYLLFVPDSPWYSTKVEEREARAAALRLDALSKKTRMLHETALRWRHLKEMRAALAENPPEDATWFKRVIRELDYLMEKYLIFADKEREFRDAIYSRLNEIEIFPGQNRDGTEAWSDQLLVLAREKYQKSIDQLNKSCASETNPSTKQILQKRIAMVEARRESIPRMASTWNNLTQQLRLIEETFGYISDELRGRSPSQILTDIENVVMEADTMTRTLEELSVLNIQ